MSLTVLIILLACGVGFFFYDQYQNKKQEQHFKELREKRNRKREAATKKQAIEEAKHKKELETPVVVTPALKPESSESSSLALHEEYKQNNINSDWWEPPPHTVEVFNTSPPIIEKTSLPSASIQPPAKDIIFNDDKTPFPTDGSSAILSTNSENQKNQSVSETHNEFQEHQKTKETIFDTKCVDCIDHVEHTSKLLSENSQSKQEKQIEQTSLTQTNLSSDGIITENISENIFYNPIQDIQEEDIIDELKAEENRSIHFPYAEPTNINVTEHYDKIALSSTQESTSEETIENALPKSSINENNTTATLPADNIISHTKSKKNVYAHDELATLLMSRNETSEFDLPFNNDLDKPSTTTYPTISNIRDNVSSPSVLLVEDTRIARVHISNILKEMGCQVTECTNGQEAFDLLCSDNNPFVDAIISDIDMPKMDGFTLFAAVQAQPKLKSIPFIIVTGHNDAVEKAHSLGIGKVLMKPFNKKEIEDAVKQCIPQFF